jgi:hypothetical protein
VLIFWICFRRSKSLVMIYRFTLQKNRRLTQNLWCPNRVLKQNSILYRKGFARLLTPVKKKILSLSLSYLKLTTLKKVTTTKPFQNSERKIANWKNRQNWTNQKLVTRSKSRLTNQNLDVLNSGKTHLYFLLVRRLWFSCLW